MLSSLLSWMHFVRFQDLIQCRWQSASLERILCKSLLEFFPSCSIAEKKSLITSSKGKLSYEVKQLSYEVYTTYHNTFFFVSSFSLKIIWVVCTFSGKPGLKRRSAGNLFLVFFSQSSRSWISTNFLKTPTIPML